MTLNVATQDNHAPERMIPHGSLTHVHGKCAVVRQIALKLQCGLDDLMSVTDMIRSVGAVCHSNDYYNASLFKFDLLRKRC